MSSDPAVSAFNSAPETPRLHRFKRGAVVHVKPGASHPIYPDLPMGGWTGAVERVQRHKEHGGYRYWIHFFAATTDRVHPIYADRESRDNVRGHKPWDNWLAEEQIEAGEAPPEAIEQPDLPAWAQQAGDRQVRTLFGLDSDDRYPECSGDTAHVWKDFLSEHVPLPHRLLTSPEDDSDGGEVILRRILGPEEVPPDVDDKPHALYAEILFNGEIKVTRLEYVVPCDDDSYDSLLRDYEHWYDVVHRDNGFWGPDDGEEKEMSPAEVDHLVRIAMQAAWKAHFGRLPDETDMKLAKSLADRLENPDTGRFFDREQEPVGEEPEDEEVNVAEPIRAEPRVGRNDPCPCGSGKKFKKCCLRGR